MTFLEAIVLGLIQGASEFLPISSSGHLILLPKLFGWQDHPLAFDEALNTGTLLAVVAYFRHELVRLTLAGLAALRRPAAADAEGRLAWMLAAATLPAAVVGLVAHDWIAVEARNPVLIACNLIVFGILLYLADRFGRRSREIAGLTWRDALLIGAAQALALVPGTSRSGITMTMALVLGFARPEAARFSFLLSVPIGLLVAVHDALALTGGGMAAVGLPALVVAVLASAVSGFAVIGWLLAWLRRQSMAVFTAYRVALGIVILAVFL